MCTAALNSAKFQQKNPYFGLQGRSRSSTLVPLQSSSAVLAIIRSKSVSICTFFHARWVNSCKITTTNGGTPLWCPRSTWISSPSGTKITSLETRDSSLWYGEDPESLSHLGLVCHRVVTDRQTDGRTDRIAIANTRYSSTCRYSCGVWRLYFNCMLANLVVTKRTFVNFAASVLILIPKRPVSLQPP